MTNLPVEGFAEDPADRFAPAQLYEVLYCARGEAENVLKQQVLDLHADRMSSHHLASNQLRLWLSAFAYLLMERVRTVGCRGTELAAATAGTIRLKLLKVAAQVKVSVRRVYVQLSTAYVRLKAHLNSRVKVPDLADTVGPVIESNCAGAITLGGKQLEMND